MVKISRISSPQAEQQELSNQMLPTMYDLPSEDPEEPGLPDEFHDLQPQLLSRTLQLRHYTQDECFSASDFNLYYDVNHPLWYKRPDWFLVVGVPHLYNGTEMRRSYVRWQEGKSPQVVVEFLSPGTEQEDLGRFYDESAKIPEIVVGGDAGVEAEQPSSPTEATIQPPQRIRPPGKFELYEKHLRVPHYLVYSRYTKRLRYFKLQGNQYEEQPLNPENPRVWLENLEVGLGIWQGVFQRVPGDWLRWCDAVGNWLLTDTEQAELAQEQERLAKEQERLAKEQERLAKEQERLAKEQAQAQLQQAARNLLATGMTPAQVAQILGFSEEQVQLAQSTMPEEPRQAPD